MNLQLIANLDPKGMEVEDLIDLVRAAERHETLRDVRDFHDHSRTLRDVVEGSRTFQQRLEQEIQSASSELEQKKASVQRRYGRATT